MQPLNTIDKWRTYGKILTNPDITNGCGAELCLAGAVDWGQGGWGMRLAVIFLREGLPLPLLPDWKGWLAVGLGLGRY